ncbi:MAG: glycosyltransferase family 4 protein [Arenimonas sp.]
MHKINSPLNIAITADPELPVPPKLYGGIERVIDMLIRGLVEQGHRVTLFAHPDSDTPASLIRYPSLSSLSRTDTLKNMMTVSRHVLGGGFDLVHSFGRIAYLLPLLPITRLPKLMTYQREVTPGSVQWGHRLSAGSLHFSAISRHMMVNVEKLANWHLVYNGVPMNVYDFSASVAPDAPLVFLGRIEHIKGTHLAIDIAKKSGRRLIIAGNIPVGESAYFDSQVKPHLDDDRIRYIGPVDDVQKNELLGNAAAFLMPILWEEPFGIVMAEALACGTPVLGLRRGSVPEIVDDGITGFVREDVQGLIDCIPRLGEIDRAACRSAAAERFSDHAIVEAYLSLYRELIDKPNHSGRNGNER